MPYANARTLSLIHFTHFHTEKPNTREPNIAHTAHAQARAHTSMFRLVHRHFILIYTCILKHSHKNAHVFRQQQQQRQRRQRRWKLKNIIFYFTRFYAMRLIILVLSTFLRQQKQQQQARAALLVRRSFVRLLVRSHCERRKKTQASGECSVEIYKCVSFSAFASNQMGMCINIIFKKSFFVYFLILILVLPACLPALVVRLLRLLACLFACSHACTFAPFVTPHIRMFRRHSGFYVFWLYVTSSCLVFSAAKNIEQVKRIF